MSRDFRDIGELGQDELKRWASQVGITANKSSMDRTGWDYQLEFPDSYSKHKFPFPLDESPPELQCRIQVKSTDMHRGNRKIKLSNWKRMVDDPLPYFILAVEFEGEPMCQRAYLIHVDEDYIRKTLKRVRTLSLKPTVRLNKHEMSFDYDDSHALDDLSGEGLAKKITSYIGKSMDEYISWKGRLRANVGYEKGMYEVSGQAVVPAEFWREEYSNFSKALIDLKLHLLPHIEIKSGEVTNIRFGTSIPDPEKNIDSGTLEFVRKPFGQASINLTTSNLKHRRTFDGTLFAAKEGEFVKWLVDLGLVKWTFIMPERRYNFNITFPDWNKIHKISELKTFADFALFFYEKETTDTPVDFIVSITTNDLFNEPLFRGTASFKNALEPWLVSESQKIWTLWKIARHLQIHDELEAQVSEIMRIEPSLLQFLASLLEREVIYTFEVSVEEDFSNFDSIGIFHVQHFYLGNFYFVFCLGHFGTPVLVKEKNNQYRYKVTTSDIRIERSFAFKRGERVPFDHEKLYEKIRADYPNLKKVFVLPDEWFEEGKELFSSR